MKKFALIIGGSSGLGLATAKKLGRSGFSLIIIHRDRRSVLEEFEGHMTELRSAGVQVLTRNVDATNRDKIKETIQSLREEVSGLKIDVMVHSISRGNLKPLIDDKEGGLTEEDISLTMDAMAINVFSWVKVLVGESLFAKGGRIITLTSAGSTKFWPGYGAVALAKASLEILTKYLAVELAKYDLRANVVNAGVTDTPSLKFIPGYDDLVRGATDRNPLGRMTLPTDVADAIYLLSLQEANWINGSIIHVDGGEHLVQ